MAEAGGRLQEHRHSCRLARRDSQSPALWPHRRPRCAACHLHRL